MIVAVELVLAATLVMVAKAVPLPVSVNATEPPDSDDVPFHV